MRRIAHLIRKEPIYMVQNPIEDYRQLRLTIYKMTHRCSFKVIMVSKSLATKTSNDFIKCIVLTLYGEFVYLLLDK